MADMEYDWWLGTDEAAEHYGFNESKGPFMSEPMGFTLGEMKACHAALMESKKQLEAHSAEIIKANGRDVYDTVWRDVGTALEKITRMAKELRQLQGENDAK